MNVTTRFSKKFLRTIASLLAALMIYETAATPISQAAVLTQPGISPIRNNGSALRKQISSKGDHLSDGLFTVPAAVGSVVEVHAPSKSGRLVYHLQDVHNNVPAQTNLAEIVSLLETHAAKQGKTVTVAVEGVSGSIDSDSISRLPDEKAKEDVGAGLLHAGYMLGEEYAAITHAPGRIKLVGIESPELYRKNVLARSASRAARNSVLVTIRETRAQLARLAPHNFSPLLTQLEKNRRAVDDGTMPLTDYVAFLKNISPASIQRHPNLARMAALSAAEAGIDFAKVEKEGRLLVEELMAGKSEKETDQMLADAQALKDGRLSPLSYYSMLIGQAKNSYPTIQRYVEYLRASDSIDPDQLFDEVMTAETEIARSLVRHPIALDLYNHIRWVEQQERFFSLNMIPQEWEKQKSVGITTIMERHAAIRAFVEEQTNDLGYRFATPSLGHKTLLAAYNGARQFYEAAENRNAAMMTNLEKVIAESDARKSLVAFVTGGFHTPGMTKLLRDRGFAYEVVRPQIETNVTLSEAVNLPIKKVSYVRPQGALTNPGVEAIGNAIEHGERGIEDLTKKLPTDPDKTPPPSGSGGTTLNSFEPITIVAIFLSAVVGAIEQSGGNQSWLSQNWPYIITAALIVAAAVILRYFRNSIRRSIQDWAEIELLSGSTNENPAASTRSVYHENLGRDYLAGEIKTPVMDGYVKKMPANMVDVDVNPLSEHRTQSVTRAEFRQAALERFAAWKKAEDRGMRTGKVGSLTMVAGEASRLAKGSIAELVLQALDEDAGQFVDQSQLTDEDHQLIAGNRNGLQQYVSILVAIARSNDDERRLHAVETLKRLLYSAKALNPAAKVNGKWYNFLAFNLLKVKKANDELAAMGYGRPIIPTLLTNEKYDTAIRRDLAKNNYYGFKERDIIFVYQPLGYVIGASVDDTKKFIEADHKKAPKDQDFKTDEERATALRYAQENEGKPLYALGKKAEGHGWVLPAMLMKEGGVKEPPIVTLRRLGVQDIIIHNLDNMSTYDADWLAIYGMKLKTNKSVVFEVSPPTVAEKGRGGGAVLVNVDGRVVAKQSEWDITQATIKAAGKDVQAEIDAVPDSPFNNATMLAGLNDVFRGFIGDADFENAFHLPPAERDAKLAGFVPNMARKMKLVPLLKAVKLPNGGGTALTVTFELRAWGAQEGVAPETVGFAGTAGAEAFRDKTFDNTFNALKHTRLASLKTQDNYDTPYLQDARTAKVELVVGNHSLFNESDWDAPVNSKAFSATAPAKFAAILLAIYAVIAAGFVIGGADLKGAHLYASIIYLVATVLIALTTPALQAVQARSQLIIRDGQNIDEFVGLVGPKLVGNIKAFANANGLKIEMRHGIFARVDKDAKVLYVGEPVLQSAFWQGVVLPHEQVHVTGPQLRSSNMAATFVNELLAWSIGVAAAVYNRFQVPVASAPVTTVADGGASYVDETAGDLAAKPGEDERALAEIVTGKSEHKSGDAGFTAVVDVSGFDTTDVAEGAAGFRQFESKLADVAAKHGFEGNGRVVFYASDASGEANLKLFKDAFTTDGVIVNPFKNSKITVEFDETARGTDVSVFARPGESLDPSHTFVLSAKEVDYQGATFFAANTLSSLGAEVYWEMYHGRLDGEGYRNYVRLMQTICKVDFAKNLTESVIATMSASLDQV